MNIDQARKIMAEQDTSDMAQALEAIATLARFYGIAHPQLLHVAADLEQVAEEIRQEPKL